MAALNKKNYESLEPMKGTSVMSKRRWHSGIRASISHQSRDVSSTDEQIKTNVLFVHDRVLVIFLFVFKNVSIVCAICT